MNIQHSPGDPATVKVELGDRSYQIIIGGGLLPTTGDLIGGLLSRPKTAIVTDENVADLHLGTLERSLAASGIDYRSIVLPAGETTKSYAMFGDLCDQLLEAEIERQDFIIALGGGVTGDLAGFAASALRRGVRFIQVPTTLLAQVDSSVGGKTGINSPHGKNLIGAFHQPSAVIADIDVLQTLPDRQLLSGYAEVVKYGLLGDYEFYSWLEKNAQQLLAGATGPLSHAIEISCRAKANIVARDERESGARALLNLGHTFGHALEAATGYSDRLLHGEGVSIGMSMAFRFSEVLGLCRSGVSDRVVDHLKSIGLPTRLSDIPGQLPGAGALLDMMRQDKKAVAGNLTFILVRDIGEAFISRDVDEATLMTFLTEELAAK